MTARFGLPGKPMTNSTASALASGDAGVIGVVAQLASIDDLALSRVVAARLGSLLGVIVVDNSKTRYVYPPHLDARIS